MALPDRPLARTLRLRTRLPLALAGFLILAQLVNPDRVFVMLLMALGLTLGVAWLWARSLRDNLHARRWSHGAWIVVGDAMVEHFELTNAGFFPLLWAEVRDHSDMPDYRVDRVVAVGGHGAFAWQSTGLCTRRGVFTLGPWELHGSDPLGLFQVTIRYPESRTLLVYPRVMRLPEFPLPHGRAGGRTARAMSVPTQADQAAGARAWQPGDSLRLVHWKLTAHMGQIMIKQFDQEPAGDLWLLLNGDEAVQAGQGQESTMEYGVTLAASLAARHLNENRAVGLVVFGREQVSIPPRPGRDHLWAILYALAHAEPSPDWPLARTLRHVRGDLGRNKTLILITPILPAPSDAADVAWMAELLQLRRQDIAAAAILLDAASFQDAPNPGLSALRDRLANHQVPTTIITKGYPFQPLPMFRRKRRVLKTLPGFGRVVEVEVEEEV